MMNVARSHNGVFVRSSLGARTFNGWKRIFDGGTGQINFYGVQLNRQVAISHTGKYQMICTNHTTGDTGNKRVLLSSNYGKTWNYGGPELGRYEQVLACRISSSGQYQYAMTNNYEDYLVVFWNSYDYGDTWSKTTCESSTYTLSYELYDIRISLDGSSVLLLGKDYSTSEYYIAVSKDYGSTWGYVHHYDMVSGGDARKFYSCDISTDGKTIIATTGNVFINRNYGDGSWVEATPDGGAQLVRVFGSGDNPFFIAVNYYDGRVWKSSNGTTWSLVTTGFVLSSSYRNGSWASASGQVIILSYQTTDNYSIVSNDYGDTWSTFPASSGYNYVAQCGISQDGKTIVPCLNSIASVSPGGHAKVTPSYDLGATYNYYGAFEKDYMFCSGLAVSGNGKHATAVLVRNFTGLDFKNSIFINNVRGKGGYN